MLEAIARDAFGDATAARRALERALDLAKPEGLLFLFLFDPAPELLERHRRLGTTHAILISEILNLLAGWKPGARPGAGGRLREPLSQSEIRVLRYLPTKLSAPEIADQFYLSVNTVKTHMRHVYDKLGRAPAARGGGAGPRPRPAGPFPETAVIRGEPSATPGPPGHPGPDLCTPSATAHSCRGAERARRPANRVTRTNHPTV